MKSGDGCSPNFTHRVNEPLADKTSFRLGGPAAVFVDCESVEELIDARRYARDRHVPLYVLGGGTNVLVHDDGVAGVVVRLKGERFTSLGFQGTNAVCGAGRRLSSVLVAAQKEGLGGLTPLAGIPGTVGGAIAMNAGTKEGYVAELASELLVLDQDDRVRTISAREAGFAYRASALGGRIVLLATLSLVVSDSDLIAEQMQRIRAARKASQPAGGRTAGCVFRNPPGRSAGELIDRCGLKGYRIGGAYVSRKHANWIINDGHAVSADVLSLINRVRSRVLDWTGVALDLEICVWE